MSAEEKPATTRGPAYLVENGLVVSKIEVDINPDGTTDFALPNPPEGPTYEVVTAEELGLDFIELGWKYNSEEKTFAEYVPAAQDAEGQSYSYDDAAEAAPAIPLPTGEGEEAEPQATNNLSDWFPRA